MMMRCWLSLLALLTLALGGGFFISSVVSLAADEKQPEEKKLDPLYQQPLPIPLDQAAAAMSVPEGFQVKVFAGEPDVRQPIAFTIDRRGRLWIVESEIYPNWINEPEGKDRVVILEDTDGNGQLDQRTVFWDKGANLSGIELGFGGVWLCATPNLIFVPDTNADDQPDGPPQIVLDGWDLKARHNVFNALTWGPDGWMYGCNGILSNSLVGAPGAPPEQRTALNCGVWRYHPTRKTFELVASGTTNPWGLDFDDAGEMFITNCVIPHLFHVIPGAHYQRMFGQDLNPNMFGLIESCADHIHWGGGKWTESRGGKGKHSEAGGGHAHAGAMVYLGDNWPEQYRNNITMCNIHGNRVNHDLLKPKGSGYVAEHGADMFQSKDEWFRGLELQYGPDGGVYISDWSDTGECHDTDAHGAHHDSGRIYKVTYGDVQPVKVDLGKLSSLELAKLQLHKNDWFVRQSRLILQERAAQGEDLAPVHKQLAEMLLSQIEISRQLRALWTLYATGGLSPEALGKLLENGDAQVRSWAIRLSCDTAAPSEETVAAFVTMAKEDRSPRVRLYLAAMLQRMPLADRWEIAAGLLSHEEDAEDQNLPLMIWYGIEPLVPADKTKAVGLAAKSKIPLVRQYIARRAVSK